jgi:Tfp pilus assembly protein PilO
MNPSRRFAGLTTGDLMFGVALFVACGAVVWRWHYPCVVQIAALEERALEQDRVRSELEAVVSTIDRIQTHTESLEMRLASYEDRVLVAQDSSAYLRVVSQIQQKCDVEVESITPSAMVHDDRYRVFPVEIVVLGSFAKNVCFVNQLEAELWSAEFDELQLRANSDSPECRLTMRVLFYAEGDEGEDSSTGDGSSRPPV